MKSGQKPRGQCLQVTSTFLWKGSVGECPRLWGPYPSALPCHTEKPEAGRLCKMFTQLTISEARGQGVVLAQF